MESVFTSRRNRKKKQVFSVKVASPSKNSSSGGDVSLVSIKGRFGSSSSSSGTKKKSKNQNRGKGGRAKEALEEQPEAEIEEVKIPTKHVAKARRRIMMETAAEKAAGIVEVTEPVPVVTHGAESAHL